MIHIGADIKRDTSLTADVCVIGSGSGGAVVAAVLAEAGAKVIVLEEGPHMPPESFSEREEEMYPALYVEGGQQTTKDFLLNVLQGRMVGGSSVINMVDNTRIPPEVVRHWTKDHAVEDLTEESLEPHYRAVERTIHSGPIEPHLINENNAGLERAAKKLGWAGEYMHTNRKGCIGSGYCLVGCRYNGKQSALITWIPRAEKAGAVVYADVRAVTLVSNGSRVTHVEGVVLDRATRRPQNGGPRVTVAADKVVCAAGSIATPTLLLRSRVANSSGQVGKNLSLQPLLSMSATFDHEMRSWRGAPQTYAITEFENHSPDWGMGGYRIEPVFAGPGMMSGFAHGFGRAHAEEMKKYARLGAVLVLFPDQPSGEVIIDGEKRTVDYTLDPKIDALMRESIYTTTQAFFAMGAEEVAVPFSEPTVFQSLDEVERTLAHRTIESGRIQFFSAHPQGTCRMGEDPARAIVDSWGKSHDLENLWITDGSVHPTSASSHTMIPIMALSHRTAMKIAAHS